MRTNKIIAVGIIIIAYYLAFLVGKSCIELFNNQPDLLQIFIADISGTIVIYFFSLLFRNNSIYDPYWSLAPIPILFFFISIHQEIYSSKNVLIIISVWIWAIRLTSNWIRGWKNLNHEDWRYRELALKHGNHFWIVSLTGIHLFPTILVFLGCLPLYFATISSGSMNFLDYLAFIICVLAVLISFIADEQLKKFTHTNENPKIMMQKGLWAYCRHPNYLGEILFWFGLYLFAISSDISYWWTGIGFLSMILLFTRISIPMMDKHLLLRNPAYQKVIEKLPSLIPFIK